MPDTFAAAANALLAAATADMREAIDGASPELVNRKPGGGDAHVGGTNSIAVLAVHSMHSTRWWLSVAVGAPLPARNRDDEFVAADARSMPDAESLLAFVEKMQADCARLLETADVADWSATARTLPADEEPVTHAWALLHALSHLREHAGQMLLTRQLAGG
jgi:hypothetical protein